jgi:hypothetical protein
MNENDLRLTKTLIDSEALGEPVVRLLLPNGKPYSRETILFDYKLQMLPPLEGNYPESEKSYTREGKSQN